MRADVLDLFARVVLAVVFLATFVGKVRSRRGFGEFRDSVGALVSLPALPLAVAVSVGEAAAVVLLAVPGARLGYCVAVVLLAVVALHVLFTYGLVARVRELQENAGAPRESNLPRPRLVVKPFSVVDTEGIPFSEADLVGAVQVGFFSVGCGLARTLTDGLVGDSPAVRFVSVVDGDPGDPGATGHWPQD